ncbi:MAG: glycoside hydrolase family 5 protein [Verrucomicrobiales bacterium]
MKKMNRKLLFGALAACLMGTATVGAKEVFLNGDFEKDTDGNAWPDGWSANANGSWESEGGNHFLRLKSPAAGEMAMQYEELRIPDGVEALKFTWKQRVTGLKKGKNSWFDARILMEFLDAERQKVAGSPKPQATGKDTDGWVEREVSFLVPEDAVWLKFMPALFQVEAGTFDLDDLSLSETDPKPVRAAVEKAQAERKEKLLAEAARRRAKAAESLAANGSLIPNGDLETPSKSGDWAAHWGKSKEGGSWVSEDGGRHLKLEVVKPGEMVMFYQKYDLPDGLEALELSWRERVTGLKKGEMPWFDARILLEFHGIDGKKVKGGATSAYTQKDTDGWVEKSKKFLVPRGSLSIVMMPSLFRANAGSFELDDFELKPTDAAELLELAAEREKARKAREVPVEEPNKAAWPLEIKVEGNRVVDVNGKEVWLRGANAGGLETLPMDIQPIKSTVVAIDDWGANCVRVPVKDSFWYGQSPYQKDDGAGYRAIIDRIVNLAANRGAYVIIDLHRYRAPKKEYLQFWKDCAAHYKNHPAVLFDLLNEPHGIDWDTWRNGGFVGTKTGKDESAFLSDEEKKKNQGFESVGMQAMLEAVRSSGARNIVLAGGLFWANDLSKITEGYALDDPDGNGVIYSWHTYNWHTGWKERVAKTFAEHPVLLGEFGADIKKMEFIPLDDQEDPHTWVPDMLGYLEKNRIHWTAWCFHPAATPRMIESWNYEPTDFYGKYIKEALAGKKFEMKSER